jgi:uncharacterized protein (DUF302 family)
LFFEQEEFGRGAYLRRGNVFRGPLGIFRKFVIEFACRSSGAIAMSTEGVVTIASHSGSQETLARLKAEILSHGLELFAEIDHAKNAAEVSLSLRPSVVLIFGNAKAGTLLMQAKQAAALDLPLRALVWEDTERKTWISYIDPVGIAQRHGLPAGAVETAGKMREGLDALIKAAAG